MPEADVLVKLEGHVSDPIISVIIPALNEADTLAPTLNGLRRQDVRHEIIVVDGGSNDATTSIARPHARVLDAPRGRALQMNCGARAAHGDILLFLHADTHLPEDGLARVRNAVDEGYEAGAFRLAFDRSTPLLRFYSFCTRFPLPRFCFGDRAVFVRRDVFIEVGGYPEIPLFEDLELVRLLHARRRFTFLSASVTTSARRFHRHGPFRQQMRNSYLWLHYVAGRDPRTLAHLYQYDRR